MTEEVGISLLQMMENAGRCLATQARSMLGGDMRGRRIVVLAGRGGNGGGGLAAARRLAVWGAAVTVVLAQSLEEMHRRLGLTVGPIFAESDIIPIDPT